MAKYKLVSVEQEDSNLIVKIMAIPILECKHFKRAYIIFSYDKAKSTLSNFFNLFESEKFTHMGSYKVELNKLDELLDFLTDDNFVNDLIQQITWKSSKI